ncbi:P-loop containing nucleoside triphosphate hydrolase protein [Phyllosticta citribraziliensis]|uniref:RNA helicase n=1 Tax=Phyllosticta citribraziliensis TaxID=989973 RepID=A0ABR1LKR2_9PEZI
MAPEYDAPAGRSPPSHQPAGEREKSQIMEETVPHVKGSSKFSTRSPCNTPFRPGSLTTTHSCDPDGNASPRMIRIGIRLHASQNDADPPHSEKDPNSSATEEESTAVQIIDEIPRPDITPILTCNRCSKAVDGSAKNDMAWECTSCSSNGGHYIICLECFLHEPVCLSACHSLACWSVFEGGDLAERDTYLDKPKDVELSVLPGEMNPFRWSTTRIDFQKAVRVMLYKAKNIKPGLASENTYREPISRHDGRDEQPNAQPPVQLPPVSLEPLDDWSPMDIPSFVHDNLRYLGVGKPTLVQGEIFKVVARKQYNSLIASEFSSGKTLGICVASIKFANKLVMDMKSSMPEGWVTERKEPKVVILCPVREHAMQTFEALDALTYRGPISVASVIGGYSRRHQVSQLRQGCDIIVATPGRLLDIASNPNGLWYRHPIVDVPFFVMDEVQAFLDDSFAQQMQDLWKSKILSDSTMLSFFSSTFSEELVDKVAAIRRFRLHVSTIPRDHVPSQMLRMANVFLPVVDEPHFGTIRLIIRGRPGDTRQGKVMIFANTRAQVDLLGKRLQDVHGLVVRSGQQSQEKREWALHEAENRTARVIITTDSYAVGVNIPDVYYVIHAYLPSRATGSELDSPMIRYIERNCHAGQFGNSAYSLAFYTNNDSKLFPELARHLVRVRQSRDETAVYEKFKSGEIVKPDQKEDDTTTVTDANKAT